MRIKFLLTTLFIFLNFILYCLNAEKTYAATGELVTFFCDDNPGTTWQVHTRMFYRPEGVWGSWTNVWADDNPDNYKFFATGGAVCGGNGQMGAKEWGRHSTNSEFQWVTSCVDPIVSFSNFEVGMIYTPLGLIAFAYKETDISCKRSGINWNRYKACGSTDAAANQSRGTVYWYEACPKQPPPICVVGGGLIENTDNCSNSCSGSNTAWQCVRNIRECNNNGCVTTDTRPLNDNCGTKNSCTNPPSGRTDSAFCQGTNGTDEAAGIHMDWDNMPYDSLYEVQLRKVGGGDLHEWSGTATQLDIPGNTCTSGPGGCSLPYDTAYEWRVRQKISTGSWAGEFTEWSNWNSRRTNDCSAKSDLRIESFTFPGGNSGGTSNATVTIHNASDKAVTKDFVVRVRNGAPTEDVKNETVNGLGARGTRTVTVEGLQRPNPNAQGNPWTARAIVDATDVVAEYNENNNDATDNYNTTSHVSGVIFLDLNNNDARDTGEPLYTASCPNVRVAGDTYPTCDGSYQSDELSKGDYNVNIGNPPPTSQYVRTTPNNLPVTETLGGNQTRNFGYRPLSTTLNLHVFEDNSGSYGVEDGTDTGYSGAELTVTGCGAGNYTTGPDGNWLISNLTPNCSATVTLTIPANYTLTTPKPPPPDNEVTITVTAGSVVNFGVQPPGPTCTSLTHSPTQPVTASGQTRTLTLTCSGIIGTPTYEWAAQSGTVPATSATNSVTWTAVPATLTLPYETIGARVCDTTGRCSNILNDQIPTQVYYTVTGNVFIDTNSDGFITGDSNYTGNVDVVANLGSATSSDINGAYTVGNLPAGTYNISYTNQPGGYDITYPSNGPPPSFTITVGASCNAGGYNSASCSSGNIINLNFGITNAIPWIQSGGSDVWLNSGINNSIPSGATDACGRAYMSPVGAGGTPGVMFSGASSYSFGGGQASLNNWVVGGLPPYSESYTPATPGVIKTSYNYINSLVSQNNIPIIDIATVCGGGGLTSCTLPSSLANGVYRANWNLTLTDASGTFVSGRDYVILVDGNLNINTSIDVPVGATAFFTADEDIHVGANVGTPTQSTTSDTNNVEGWFSADRSFYADGANVCPTPDLRLNVEGAIVVNASLQGGSFVNNRTLCAGDTSCPVFYVKERPDFVLNAPLFLQSTRRVWQEVAP